MKNTKRKKTSAGGSGVVNTDVDLCLSMIIINRWSIDQKSIGNRLDLEGESIGYRLTYRNQGGGQAVSIRQPCVLTDFSGKKYIPPPLCS